MSMKRKLLSKQIANKNTKQTKQNISLKKTFKLRRDFVDSSSRKRRTRRITFSRQKQTLFILSLRPWRTPWNAVCSSSRSLLSFPVWTNWNWMKMVRCHFLREDGRSCISSSLNPSPLFWSFQTKGAWISASVLTPWEHGVDPPPQTHVHRGPRQHRVGLKGLQLKQMYKLLKHIVKYLSLHLSIVYLTGEMLYIRNVVYYHDINPFNLKPSK